ncbi:uncharacterized protein FIBRA_01906 [Fibroporia radiculosa]|uniref:Inhibitor I9 domain-containing protein n=1 Tax=Fibroporia radiculosa TaxID=599839 RepID=J4I8R7_9APHY|nr:uncharacterized protein FIBRA_01906 [Fibroporia radiculosa]CCL99881.1 predicted protein [Fibroporia radiculosa]
MQPRSLTFVFAALVSFVSLGVTAMPYGVIAHREDASTDDIFIKYADKREDASTDDIFIKYAGKREDASTDDIFIGYADKREDASTDDIFIKYAGKRDDTVSTDNLYGPKYTIIDVTDAVGYFPP